jgi:uncharacterized protein (TIGR00251 family)
LARPLDYLAPSGGAASMNDSHIEVRLQPRAHRDELVGLRDGVLVARVCAPPVDGEANHALCRLIAHHVGIAPTRITVISGKQARLKLLRVKGFDQEVLIEALGVIERRA